MNRSATSSAGIGILAVITVSAFAQITGPATFDLSWNTIDCGGGASAGGQFELAGTIGQHDATPGAMAGGPFEVIGGFWAGVDQPDLPPCPSDLNGDSIVNGIDLGILLANWSIPPTAPGCDGAPGPGGCPADLNQDGLVNGIDLGILLANWGPCN